ncbi:MAG: hypothetical protein ABI778_05640 [Ignavibacteriota bacterium]
MRLLLELFALFFAVTTIYRRLIVPFLDGLRSHKRKSDSPPNEKSRFSTEPKKNIDHPDPKKIQDAEFEEIS